MPSDSVLDTIRTVAVINPTEAQKLLTTYSSRVHEEINKPHRCEFRLTEAQVTQYCTLFAIPKKLFINGDKQVTHPISAALRNDATKKILAILPKLKNERQVTVRLYNPTEANLNQIINLNLFDKFEVFSSKQHYSDLKRWNINPNKLRNNTSRDVEIQTIYCDNMNATLRVTRDTILLLFDDIYHMDAAQTYDFCAGINNQIISTFSLLPLFALATGKDLQTTFGARVEFTFGGQYNVAHDEENTYTHYLEDGTFYTGSIKNLAQNFAVKNYEDATIIPKLYEVCPEFFPAPRKLQKNWTNINKVLEPINPFHGYMVMGKTQISKNPGSVLKIQGHRYINYDHTSFLLPEAQYNALRNYLLSTDPSKLTYSKIFAYIRNEDLLKTLDTNQANALIFTLLAQYYQIHKHYETELMNTTNSIIPMLKSIFKTVSGAKLLRLSLVVYQKFNFVNPIDLPAEIAITWLTSYDIINHSYPGESYSPEPYHLPGKVEKTQKKKTEEIMQNMEQEATALINQILEDSQGHTNPDYKDKRDTWLKYATFVEQQMVEILKVCNPESVGPLKALIKDIGGKEKPIVDYWINGVAGSGKTVDYFSILNDLSTNLEEYVVILPTGDLVDELSQKLDKSRPGWRDINSRLFQTYARGLTHIQGKKVIQDEAWLSPSAVLVVLSFLRAKGVINELIVVGDKYQNLFNEEIIPGQNWNIVMKMIQQSALRVKMLTKMRRCGPLVAELLKIVDPNFQIESIADFDTVVEILENDINLEGALYIGQSNVIVEFDALKGRDALNTVQAQGATVDRAIFKPVQRLFFPGFYVGITRAQSYLGIKFPPILTKEMAEIKEKFRNHIANYEYKLPIGPHPFYEELIDERDEVMQIQGSGISDFEEACNNIYVPSEISEEVAEKLNILARTVGIEKEMYVLKPDYGMEDLDDQYRFDINDLENLFNDYPIPEIPENIIDLNNESLHETDPDLVSLTATTSAANHNANIKPLVKKSMEASFARNPELITEDIDLDFLYPDLADFHPNYSPTTMGRMVDRYVKKLNLKTLEAQITEDINEMIMSFKRQLKGGILTKNKVNRDKVGQIVRASSKFYQIRLGFLINVLAEQVHHHLKKKGTFICCAEDDKAADQFIKDLPYGLNVITYDTVKNESRIGPKTKKFERNFMHKYSDGMIPMDLLEQHDLDLYVLYKEEKIECDGMRNSGEPGTLFRNAIANDCLARLRTPRHQTVYKLIKGDNTALFTSQNNCDLRKAFEPLARNGTIEIDDEPEWTSYKIIDVEGYYQLLPNYSYIGERIYSNMISQTKIMTDADMDNYRILYKKFDIHYSRYQADYPECFNDFAFQAHRILFDYDTFIWYLQNFKLQLLSKKQIQSINQYVQQQTKKSDPQSSSRSAPENGI